MGKNLLLLSTQRHHPLRWLSSVTLFSMSTGLVHGAEPIQLNSGYLLPIICGVVAASATVGFIIWLNHKKRERQLKREAHRQAIATPVSKLPKSPRQADHPGDRTTEILIRHSTTLARMSGWSIDLESSNLTWSPGLPQLFGHTDESMPRSRQGLLSLYPLEEQHEWKALIERLLSSGQVETIELMTTWRDGTKHWIMSRLELANNEKNKAAHINGISIDITERKRMEEELRLKEQLLTRGFEAAGVGVWEWDTRSNNVTWNGRVEELFGLLPGTFGGTFEDYLNVIHPDDVANVKETIKKSLDSGGGFRIEHRINNKSQANTTDRWLAGRGDVLRDERGNTTGMAGVIMDITNRRRAENELRLSEERYRAVVSSMAEGVVIHAADGSIIDCNQSAENILGLTRDQLMGRINTDPRWKTIKEDGSEFPPAEHPSALAQSTGKSQRKVTLGVHLPDSSLRWLSVNADPLFPLNKSQPIGAVATISDVTHRLHVERQLRESEQRWRTLAENVPDYIAMVDRLGTLLFINHLAEGFTTEDVLGAPVDKFMPPEFAQVIKDGISKIFDKGETFSADIRAEGDHHVMRWYSCHLSPVKHQGRTIAAIIRASDITDRIEAENNRRQHEQERVRLLHRLETLIDRMPVGCIMWDKDGIITSSNPAVERIYGYLASELVGELVTRIAPDVSLNAIKESHQIPLGGGHISLLTGKAKSGAVITSEWHSTLTHNESGQMIGVISMMMDVSQRELLEEELRQSQKMEAIGKLAGGIAHDFNNLLTAIMGYGELLSNRLSISDPSVKYVEQIKKAAQRAAALTYQLLAFSRKQVLQTQLIIISTVIQDLETLLRRLIGEHITLEFDLPNDVWEILADTNQIEQVVMNLAVNGRDAMRRGGTLTISAKNITLDEHSDKLYAEAPRGEYVLLSVKDTGEGMSPDVRKRIFEPFFTTKPEGKGTGLGLAVVFGVVRQTGGYIFVDSAGEGLGAKFEIFLPHALDQQEAIPNSDSTALLAVRGDETILLVEDDDAVRNFAKDSLESSGYTVMAVADGVQAIEISEHYPKKIDVLLTDVVMPNMGGREVAEAVLKKRPDIRILYMSGYTDDMVLAHGVAEGTKSFLEKPFTAPKLLGRIRKVLSGHV